MQGGQTQLLRGWRPVTEATSDAIWSLDSIEANRDALLAKFDTGVPPFMPSVEG